MIDEPVYNPTATRLQLLRSGFDPLPLKGKRPLIKDWSRIEIDEAMINSREWARSASMKNTGIRCGDVVGIDFDIANTDILDELYNRIEAAGIELSSFTRIGREPRELLVYRTLKPFGKRLSGLYTSKVDDELLRVEVLGKGSQFAAYGTHPGTGRAFTWPDDELGDMLDLPLISLEQAEQVIAMFDALAQELGLERVLAAGVGESYEHRATLSESMIFEVVGVGPLAVGDMASALSPERRYRCAMTPIRPESTAADYGSIIVVDDAVVITDHGADQASYTINKSAILRSAIDVLGPKLAPLIDKQRRAKVEATTKVAHVETLLDLPLVETDDTFDEALLKVINRYALCENDVLDLVSGRTMAVSAMRLLTATHKRLESKKAMLARGGQTPKTFSLVDVWLNDERRLAVAGIRTSFDAHWPVYHDDMGMPWANLWRTPSWPVDVGTVEPFLDFMERLIPDAMEHDWLLDWISWKMSHPGDRGVGVLIVASNTYGTGRGTLCDILTLLIGEQFTANISSRMLLGENYQSQYNDWLSGSALVIVDELQEEVSTRFSAKRSAYEHVKSLIDPGSGRQIQIVNKGTRNEIERVHASMVMSTNHADALIIPEDDRRLTVLSAGPKMTNLQVATIRDWMADARNLAALWHWLRAREYGKGFNFNEPIETHAKRVMIENGFSDMDLQIMELNSVCIRMGLSHLSPLQMLYVMSQLEKSSKPSMKETLWPGTWRSQARAAFTRLTEGTGRTVRLPAEHGGATDKTRLLPHGKPGSFINVTAEDLTAMVTAMLTQGPVEVIDTSKRRDPSRRQKSSA